jgi:hypothetical protein
MINVCAVNNTDVAWMEFIPEREDAPAPGPVMRRTETAHYVKRQNTAEDAALMEQQVQKLNLSNTAMGRAILEKKVVKRPLGAAGRVTPRRMERLGAVRREMEKLELQAQAAEAEDPHPHPQTEEDEYYDNQFQNRFGSGTTLGSAEGNLTPTLSNKKEVLGKVARDGSERKVYGINRTNTEGSAPLSEPASERKVYGINRTKSPQPDTFYFVDETSQDRFFY